MLTLKGFVETMNLNSNELKYGTRKGEIQYYILMKITDTTFYETYRCYIYEENPIWKEYTELQEGKPILSKDLQEHTVKIIIRKATAKALPEYYNVALKEPTKDGKFIGREEKKNCQPQFQIHTIEDLGQSENHYNTE